MSFTPPRSRLRWLAPARPLALLVVSSMTMSCEDVSTEDRCVNIESRLSAELLAQPASCRDDADCHPVQAHCGVQWSLGAAPPISVTRLAKQFEDLGCCGGEPFWDGFTPKELPEVGCTEGPEGGGNVCATRVGIRCGGACRVLDSCVARDSEGWAEHDDGCDAGCSEAMQADPARTQRLVNCVATQGCASEDPCP